MPQRLLPLLLLPLLCAATAGLAQKVVVSQEITLKDDDRYEVFAGTGDMVILYRDDANSADLTAFNSAMEKTWTRELNLDKARPHPVGGLMYNGETVVFYTYRKSRGVFLKMHRYSDAGNLSDSLTVTELDGSFLTADYQLNYSTNGQYAILTHQRDSRTWLALGVEVATGRLLYKQTIEFGADGRWPDEVSAPYVDDSGVLLMWSQSDNRRSRLEEHVVQVIRVTPAGELTSLNIPLKETLVYDLELGVDERNRSVVLGGYYATDPDQAAGVMLLRIPYEFQGPPLLLTRAFSPAIIASIDPRDKRLRGIENLDALHLFFRRDGAALVVGEQRRATVRTVGGRGGTFGSTMKTDYLYEDIVLSTIGTPGSSAGGDWTEVLPKKQFSQDDGAAFSSYSYAMTPSTLRLIYNDEVRSGGTVSEYTLDGTGRIGRHSIMNTEYQDLWLRHEAGIQLSGTEMVIPSERRNRLRLVRLSY